MIAGTLGVFTLGFTQDAHAKSNPKYASIVMDSDTGLILHQRYADKRLHPASITKVMTLMLVFDALKEGRIRLHDRVHISKRAAGMVPSKIGLPAGSSIKVKDAILALVTKSANDIAVALAEKIGGTEYNFAKMMTKKARSLGMKRTTFKNASGLHHKAQVSTARDIAKMAQVVIQDYPKYYRYFSTKSFRYKGKTYNNHNRLMKTYKGMDGMKTGYINASGFNLVASAVRNNRRVIGVVLGGRTTKSRNAHMAVLLDKGFSRINDMRIAHAKAPLPARKPQIILALNQLKNITPASGTQTASLDSKMKTGTIGELLGQGDIDHSASDRFRTGLIAIAAHKNRFSKAPATKSYKLVKNVAYQKSKSSQGWAIQIGAFKSRAVTDKAISKTLAALPRRYANANPIIAPLKTESGWLFRGRLSGYTKQDAYAACKHLKECLPVSPYN